MYANFPITGYARPLNLMCIWRELGGTGAGCLFQFTYCDTGDSKYFILNNASWLD